MSRWTERTHLEDVSLVLRKAASEGFWNEHTRAALFHDLDRVRDRIGELRDTFPAGSLHTVAIKANPIVELLRVAVAAGAGLEAASFEEVSLALAAGCPPARIVFDSPAKTVDEIAAALKLGVHFNIDNLDELARVAAHIPADFSGIVGMRVNPQIGAGSIDATSVASRSSKFGVPIERREDILHAFENHAFLRALHVHVGSQGMPLEKLVMGIERVFSLRADIEERVGIGRIQSFDIGGGLPVAYHAEDRAISIHEYSSALRAAGIFSTDVQIVTEFGRAIHATTGWAASRVEYVKQAGDERIAVIHLGADLLLRRAYRPDQWFHELSVLNADGEPKQTPIEPVTVVGPLCFAGDVLAHEVRLPRIEPGDIVIVHDVGAYTMSMWSRHCSRGMPIVVGYDEKGLSLLRSAESPADVIAFWEKNRSRA